MGIKTQVSCHGVPPLCAAGASPEPYSGPGEISPRFPSRGPRCPPPGASRRLRGVPAAGAGPERSGDWLGTAGAVKAGGGRGWEERRRPARPRCRVPPG